MSKNIDKIINRTEFRILECDDGLRYEITAHNDNLEFGCAVVTSAQGGPLLYPDLRLEEEFFIVRDEAGKVVRESANVLHKTSRTIIALKNDDVHILVITKENPMDMYEVRALCEKLGFERAMGFDGGGSTSMNYLNKYNVVSEGGGRKLKSFLIVR